MEQSQLGTSVILPDFVLPSRVNQCWQYSGIDSIEHCLDKNHFEQYPHSVIYNYNSRGFRDQEWPNTIEELANAIWCIGDSFTVGIGSPLTHTWPWLLQQQTGRRVINVSMDGASNMWIARKSLDIVNKIKPTHVVIQWSYISRREKNIDADLENNWQEYYNNIKDPSWPHCTRHTINQLPKKILEEIDQAHGNWRHDIHDINDEHLRLMSINCTVDDDIKNTLDCINSLCQNGSTQIIHSFIPGFVPDTHQGIVESQINGRIIPEIHRLDVARDGHHYDIDTSRKFVQQIAQYLN
jgi:hypothetical protein